jgi:hypothetical protein
MGHVGNPLEAFIVGISEESFGEDEGEVGVDGDRRPVQGGITKPVVIIGVVDGERSRDLDDDSMKRVTGIRGIEGIGVLRG